MGVGESAPLLSVSCSTTSTGPVVRLTMVMGVGLSMSEQPAITIARTATLTTLAIERRVPKRSRGRLDVRIVARVTSVSGSAVRRSWAA